MKTEDGYIISKCLNGDHDAFGLLVDKYKAGVYALAYSRLHNFHDAEDVSQEVFIKVYEKLHTLRRWERFSGWLYRITIHLCANWLKINSRRPDSEYVEDKPYEMIDSHATEDYHERQVFDSIQDALSSLSEEHREVIMLHYFGGMTSFEISVFAGVSPSAVRRRLLRARLVLKEEMLDTLSIAFDGKRLQAGFTLRVLEKIRHIKPKPPLRDKIISWGTSITGALIVVILGMGLSKGLVIRQYAIFATESSGAVGKGNVPVYITDEAEIESGGGEDVLGGKKISAFVTAMTMLAVMSSDVISVEAPAVEWTKTFGTAGTADPGKDILQTADGGYLVLWVTRVPYRSDICLTKIDANGETQWQKIHGGTGERMGECILQTPDGGYIIAGGITPSGYYDGYLLRVNGNGDKLWEMSYGDQYGDIFYSVQLTNDGNYTVSGHTGHIVGGTNADACLLKVRDDGDHGTILWAKTYDFFNADDAAHDVKQTSDNGYIACGWTRQYGDSSAGEEGFLIKTDENGELIWKHNYGGPSSDSLNEVLQASDGGYVTCGRTTLSGFGGHDGYLVRVDADGLLLWQKNFGSSGDDVFGSIKKTPDGGYIAVGAKTLYNGRYATYLVKLDNNFDKEWEQTYGTDAEVEEYGIDAICTSDNGYAIICTREWGPWADEAFVLKLFPENQLPINQPPIAEAGGPYTADEGSSITFDGSGSADPDGDSLQYRWSFDDGVNWTAWSDSPIASHTWDDDYIGIAKLEVWDGKAFADDTAEVTVNNVDPDVVAIVAPLEPIKDNKAAPEVVSNIPDETLLLTAYPNPANPEVWIPYQLAEDTDVTVRIYSVSGQLVRTLELGHKPAGIYASNSKSAYWDGRNEAGESVKSGVYFYSIRAGGYTSTGKMLIQK